MPHLLVAAQPAGLLDVNGTLIAEAIAFIVMVLILARWAYPFIIRVAEEREKKIEAGVRAAEEAEKRLADVQTQVQQVLNEAREQAREVIARAHRDATGEAEDVRTRARSDAESTLQRAQEEIRAERDRAIKELRSQMASLVVEATGIVVGETLDQRSHQRLIDEALTRVGSGNGRERNA